MVVQTNAIKRQELRRADDARWSDWMARAQQGDREAYETLMTELCTVVEAFIRARFGGVGDAEFFEDCVQESLLAVHRARHTYDPRRPFRPWLFTLVRHKTIDVLRKQRVRGRVSSLEEEAVAEPAAVAGAEPSERLDGAAILAWLKPTYREALLLTKFEGCSVKEAAERAGVSVAAMKTRVHRAIRAAQKRLQMDEAP